MSVSSCFTIGISVCVYMRCYVNVVMNYGDVAGHYGDVAPAGTNCNATATVQ